MKCIKAKMLMATLLSALLMPFAAQAEQFCHNCYQEEGQLESEIRLEAVITVPLEHLSVTSEGIFVLYEDQLWEAQSLERTGEQWTVRVASYGSCPNRHMKGCPHGCAVRGCSYFCYWCNDNNHK